LKSLRLSVIGLEPLFNEFLSDKKNFLHEAANVASPFTKQRLLLLKPFKYAFEFTSIPCLNVQGNPVICGLFICNFAYLRLRITLFSRTYPPICSHPWSLYIRAYFLGPYLSHITRSACTTKSAE